VGAPDCEKAELQHIYLLMKINGLKLAHWLISRYLKSLDFI
jgi:hypothetical protein